MELAVNRPIKNTIIEKVYTTEKKEFLQKLKDEKRIDEAKALIKEIKDKIEAGYLLADGKLELSEAQRKAYTTIGGLPQLDHEYTVFGEIIDGMEVIDKIAALKTDKNNRPYTDVVITAKMIK